MKELTPTYLGTIEPAIRDTVESLCRELPQLVEVRHDLDVVVVPAPAVNFDGRCGLGVFVVGPPYWPWCQIYLAGERPEDVSLDCWCDSVAETLAHELEHYQQWRDGAPLSEDDVEERALALLAQTSYRRRGRWCARR